MIELGKSLSENPFPSICGRVCIHPCEEVCNRINFDEALAINALERWVGDYALNKG
jgi:NADH-quinone oxidoreductase subunit F